jgi:hypothetical protein
MTPSKEEIERALKAVEDVRRFTDAVKQCEEPAVTHGN